MPFKSKSQRRALWAKAEEGEIYKDTVREWERKTDNKDNLPEKVDSKKEGALKQAIDVPYSQIDAISRKMGLPSIEEIAKKDPEIATKMLGLDKLTKTPSIGSLDVPLSGKEKAMVAGGAGLGAAGGTGIGLYQYNKAQERMEKESSLKISNNLGRLEALQKLGLE